MRAILTRTAPLVLALAGCASPASVPVGKRGAATTVTATPGTILGVVQLITTRQPTSVEVQAEDDTHLYTASAQGQQQLGHPACPPGSPACCAPTSDSWCYSLQVEAQLAHNYTLRPVAYISSSSPYVAITIPFPQTATSISPPAGGTATAPTITFNPAHVHGAFSASDMAGTALPLGFTLVSFGDLTSTFCASGQSSCALYPQSQSTDGSYANFLIGGDSYNIFNQGLTIDESGAGVPAQTQVSIDFGTPSGLTLSAGQDLLQDRSLSQVAEVSGVVRLPDPSNPANNVPIYNVNMGVTGTTTTPGPFGAQYQTLFTSPTTSPIPYTGRVFNVVDFTRPIQLSPILTLSADGSTLVEFPPTPLSFPPGNRVTQDFTGQYATISGRVTLSPPYPIKNGAFPNVEVRPQEVNGTFGLGRTTWTSDANGGSFVMPAFGTPAYAGNFSLWRFGWNLDLGDPNYVATYTINNYLNLPVQVRGGANVTPPAFDFCTSFVDVFFSAPTNVAGTTVSDPQLGALSKDSETAFAEGKNQDGVTTAEARMVLRPHSSGGAPVAFSISPSAQINPGGTPSPGRTTFTPFTLTPSCGDRTVVGVPGPIALTVTAPQEGQVFPVCQIPVTGLATGVPNIGITVNGRSVADPSTGNPADPLQVGFNTTLYPAPGPVTIAVTATDAGGDTVTDTRHVSCLRYPPPAITCPAASTVACTSPAGGAGSVTVGLSDPAGLPLRMTWSIDGAIVHTDTTAAGASSDTFTGTIPPYAHTVTVTADDGTGNTASCSTQVTVPAPLVNLTVTSSQLPITHRLVLDPLGWSSNGDTCVRLTSTRSAQVFSNEADVVAGVDGQYSPDQKAPSMPLQYLRAEADPAGSGRVYLIIGTFTDVNGHTARSCATVTVPLDATPPSVAAASALAQAAKATCDATGAPPAGYVQVGTGPVLGPYQ